MKSKFALIAMIGAVSAMAAADDREKYNERAANSDMAMFQELDLNRDGKVTRAEAKGFLAMEARFDDIDIDHDDQITRDEMTRYIERAYGVKLTAT